MTAHRTIATFALVGLLACKGPPQEFVLTVESDTDFKVFDTYKIWIDALNDGKRFQPQTKYIPLEGTGLPATFGIAAPPVPGKAELHVVGIASRSTSRYFTDMTVSAEFSPNQIVQNIARLSYLCECSGIEIKEDETYAPIGTCNDAGKACIDGLCEERTAPGNSAFLKPDEPCFDTVRCFDGGDELDFTWNKEDDQRCMLTLTEDTGSDNSHLNVALLTDGNDGGDCGKNPNKCYIPLNESGFERQGKQIWLPCQVCERISSTSTDRPSPICDDTKLVNGKPSFKLTEKEKKRTPPNLLGVKVVRCSDKKTADRSICRGPKDSQYPVLFARNQAYPVSIAVSGTTVYWINGGTVHHNGNPDIPSKVMKSDQFGDATTFQLANSGHKFRDIAVGGSSTEPLVFWTDSIDGSGNVWCARGTGKSDAGKPTQVFGKGQPEAIARVGQDIIYWTQSDGIHRATAGDNCIIFEEKDLFSKTPIASPSDIVALSADACWTSAADVTCSGSGELKLGFSGDKPHALAIHFTDDKMTSADFGAIADFGSGDIVGLSLIPPPMSMNVSNKDETPSGVAIDKTHVYWTTWNNGRVYRAPRERKTAMAPRQEGELLAEGQNHPSAIVVDENYIYWVNEGSIYAPTGSIAVLAKPPMPM